MTAGQYIGWALYELGARSGFKPIRSELPDLYGKTKLFDAALVTNRMGRFAPAGFLVCATILALFAHHLSGPILAVVILLVFGGMLGAGWILLGGYGALIASVLFLPLIFVKTATWLVWIKAGIGLGLAAAGWTTMSFLGLLLGGLLGVAINIVPVGFEYPVAVQVALELLFGIAGWSILSTSAVIVAFKAADDLSFTELVGELKQLSTVIPSPGAVDAFEYYGACVLVFEKPVPSRKRDQLISLRQASPLGRMITDLWIVELDAGTMYALDVPWNIRKFTPPLNEVMGRKDDPPALPEVEASIGQRSARTTVAYATLGLFIVNTLVHLLVYTTYAESTPLRLLRVGSSHAVLMEEAGQWWRGVTHMFLHGGWEHLIGNMVGLLEGGRGVEVLFGSRWTLTLYLLTGLTAEGMSLWLNDWKGLGLGASGAVFGLGGVLAAVFLFRGRRLSVRYRSHLLVMAAYCIWFLFVAATSGGWSYVNNWAHLGGFLGGLAMGLVLPFKDEDGPSPWHGSWWALGSVAVIVGATAMVPMQWEWAPEEFTKLRSTAAQVVVERPQGWWERRVKGNALVLENGLGADIACLRRPDDIGGMLLLPVNELRHLFEGWVREAEEGEGTRINRDWREPWEAVARQEVTEFDASFVPFAAGKALSVRYVISLKATIYRYFLIPTTLERSVRMEQIFLPLKDGHLVVVMESPPEDLEYYRPIFGRIRNTFVSLDEPLDWIAPQAQPSRAGNY